MASKVRNIFREIGWFLTSGTFLKNALGIALLIGAILFLSTIWMRFYTNHGETFQVKDYVGMELEDAIAEAEDKGFNIAISDSVFIVGKAPHTVLEQNPKAMSRVKENRTIYLRITKWNADLKTLPSLSGGNDDYSQYSRKLKELGIRSKIIGREFNNKLSANTILHVIAEGDTITDKLRDKFRAPMGSTVYFVVSERGASNVSIPKLICEQFREAEFIISNYNLNIGSVVPDATVTNESRAYVWRQVPEYKWGQTMRIGEQITLYLTQHKPETCGGKKPKPQNDLNIEAPQDNSANGQSTLPATDQQPSVPVEQTPPPAPAEGSGEEEEEGFGDEFEEGGR